MSNIASHIATSPIPPPTCIYCKQNFYKPLACDQVRHPSDPEMGAALPQLDVGFTDGKINGLGLLRLFSDLLLGFLGARSTE